MSGPAWPAVLLALSAVLLWPGGSGEHPLRRSTRAGTGFSGDTGFTGAVGWRDRLRRRGLDPGGDTADADGRSRWWRRRRAAEVGDAAAAELGELLALGLEAGLAPDEALDLAREAGGAAVARAATALSEHRDVDSMVFLLAATSLSDALGTPLAPAAATAGRVARGRLESRDRLRTVVAGPRTSMWLLTALPVVGPLLVVAVGMPPGEVFGTRAAVLLVGCGLVLTAAGWALSARLLSRAVRPRTLEEGRG